MVTCRAIFFSPSFCWCLFVKTKQKLNPHFLSLFLLTWEWDWWPVLSGGLLDAGLPALYLKKHMARECPERGAWLLRRRPVNTKHPADAMDASPSEPLRPPQPNSSCSNPLTCSNPFHSILSPHPCRERFRSSLALSHSTECRQADTSWNTALSSFCWNTATSQPSNQPRMWAKSEQDQENGHDTLDQRFI